MGHICEFIRNLLHPPKDPSSGFMRKIISQLCGLLHSFKQQKEDKAAMSTTNRFDEHLELGLLDEANHSREFYEPSASPISMEQQKVTEEEELGASTIKTEVKADEDDDEDNYVYCRYCRKIGEHYTDVCPNRSKDRVMVCVVCRDPYPCANQKEHGEKGIQVSKYCYSCFQYDHWTQDCEAGHENFLII